MDSGDVDWEKRPGGMLVQKRPEGCRFTPVRAVTVRVSYGATRFQVSVSSQATFGELKKLLITETNLQPADQRIIYKGKERQNGDFLDLCGVKNRSKIVLEEDPASLERRYIEKKMNVKTQFIQNAISDVSIDVDKLADQVTAIEETISNGNKVADVQITTLIEMFMRQAVTLDRIPAEGEASSQKMVQGKTIQKCVETLDVLKDSNERAHNVVVTTKWEFFD